MEPSRKSHAIKIEFISVAQCQMTPLKVWLHTALFFNVNENYYFLMEPSRKSHAIELSLFLWCNVR